jgi:hypothetical protein
MTTDFSEHGYTRDLYDAPEVDLTAGLSDREQWNQYAAVLAETLDLPVKFRYVKSENDDPVDRRLINVEVRVTRDADLLIVGKDPDRLENLRSFRLDRITNFIQIDR